jgi:hypothetical protein
MWIIHTNFNQNPLSGLEYGTAADGLKQLHHHVLILRKLS